MDILFINITPNKYCLDLLDQHTLVVFCLFLADCSNIKSVLDQGIEVNNITISFIEEMLFFSLSVIPSYLFARLFSNLYMHFFQHMLNPSRGFLLEVFGHLHVLVRRVKMTPQS